MGAAFYAGKMHARVCCTLGSGSPDYACGPCVWGPCGCRAQGKVECELYLSILRGSLTCKNCASAKVADMGGGLVVR